MTSKCSQPKTYPKFSENDLSHVNYVSRVGLLLSLGLAAAHQRHAILRKALEALAEREGAGRDYDHFPKKR